MKQKKHDLIPFSFYDLTGIARHLEKQAARGWMIEKISNFGWRYRAIPPQKLHFTATYYPPASDFEPEPSDGELTFQDFCLHSGWKFAGSNGPLQVFYTDQPDPLPIHTEPTEELRMIRKIARKGLPFGFFMLIISLFGTYGGLATAVFEPIRFWANPSGLYGWITWCVLLVYFGADLFTYFRWTRRAKQAAGQGEFLPSPGCHKILLAGLCLVGLGLLFYLLSLIHQPFILLIFFILILYMAFLRLAVNGIKKFLKKKKVSARLNLVLTLAVDLLLALGMMIGLTFGLIRLAGNGALSLSQLQAPLSLIQLTSLEESEVRQSSYLEGSLLASRSEYHQSPPLEEMARGLPSLDYTLLRTWLPLLEKPFLNQLYREGTELSPDFSEDTAEYRPIDAGPWGARKAYQLFWNGQPKDQYLLYWQGTLAQLEYDGQLGPEEKALIGQALAGK